MRKYNIIFLLVIFFSFSSFSYAVKKEDSNSKLIEFYQNHISNIDGDRCPMYPSCSSYSQKAFKKHGFFLGWVMTFDGSEVAFSEIIEIDGKRKCFDPVEFNDFWWKE